MANGGSVSAPFHVSLGDLRTGMCLAATGPTQHWGACAEAASVCLQTNGHIPPEILIVLKTKTGGAAILGWARPTENESRGWKDPQVAAEWGAYGVAALLISRLTPYKVLERSAKGGGFDYWLTKEENEDVPPFQYSARMEVSGIMCGYEMAQQARVSSKLKQMVRSDDSIPRYVAVVEFSGPCAVVVEK